MSFIFQPHKTRWEYIIYTESINLSNDLKRQQFKFCMSFATDMCRSSIIIISSLIKDQFKHFAVNRYSSSMHDKITGSEKKNSDSCIMSCVLF